MFDNNLRMNDGTCELHIFQEGGNGFGLAIGRERLKQWKDLCSSWIKSFPEK